MFVTILSPAGAKMCVIEIIEPGSTTVRELHEMAIALINAGLSVDGTYLRPQTWDKSWSLLPNEILPQRLDTYVLDTRKNRPVSRNYKVQKENIDCMAVCAASAVWILVIAAVVRCIIFPN